MLSTQIDKRVYERNRKLLLLHICVLTNKKKILTCVVFYGQDSSVYSFLYTICHNVVMWRQNVIKQKYIILRFYTYILRVYDIIYELYEELEEHSINLKTNNCFLFKMDQLVPMYPTK